MNASFGAVNMNRRNIMNRNKKIVEEKEEQKEEEKIHKCFSEKNLKGIYDCVICCEEYNESEILFPCKISKNHTICKVCYEVWKENCCSQYKDVTCPTCREVLPKNGIFIYYYDNGLKRQEVNYLNDVPHGLVQLWSPEGVIQKKFYTENNKYHGLYEEYDSNGFLKQRSNYNNGIFDGIFEEYYPYEFIKVRCNYNKGAIVGKYQLYYKSSLLFLECECGPIGGKINGTLQVWNEDGELTEHYNCKNGKIDIKFDDELNVSYSHKSGTFDPIQIN
jgi:antitoxin component YwqK of YwqJK toxin-antitoxin module